MNCNDVAAIVDSHRSARLTPAERTTVDEHCLACEDCDAAWHAHSELLALRIPAMPSTLLERALRVSRLPPVAQSRRAWRPIAIGASLLAGAALAGVAIVSLTGSPSAGIPPSTGGEPSADTESTPASVVPNAAVSLEERRSTSTTTSVELVNTGVPPVPFLRIPPSYPPDALAENLEGNVIIESTVTATGEVEDARVVEPTDDRLAAAALDAYVQWKYLPRIVAGKRAATENIRTAIRFQTAPTPTGAGIQRPLDPAAPGLPFDSAAFAATMLTAWQRVIADDLRGAELALDEFRATYALPPFTEGEVWNAYAYVYTLQGNYDRAIEAYEASIAVFTGS